MRPIDQETAAIEDSWLLVVPKRRGHTRPGWEVHQALSGGRGTGGTGNCGQEPAHIVTVEGMGDRWLL